jgi:hypothetical protein
MSHHGREDEPSHSESDWRAACRDSQDYCQAIRNVLDGTWSIGELTHFAERKQIIRSAVEIAREKRAKKQALAQQISALNAELAKLEGA